MLVPSGPMPQLATNVLAAATGRTASLARTLSSAATVPRQFVIHPSVQDALHSSNRRPVVALESTIITHGLPQGVNHTVAKQCEQVIRDAGAVPATIALIEGKIHVGVEDHHLLQLAESAASQGRKASSIKTARRDMAAVLSAKKIGGTTVSATAYIAHLAGIKFFATGGIGGVHRGAENTFDISSDLTTLSEVPINLFASGAKSILSLPLTLEYLETLNVPIYSFGAKGEFPAFYTSSSGLFVNAVDSAEHAADVIWTAQNVVRQRSGSLFAVPIPVAFEAQGREIQAHVEQAVKESVQQGVDQRGKEVTPWLLQRVSELSKGKSLTSNEALVVNNAATAAKVAVLSHRLEVQRSNDSTATGKPLAVSRNRAEGPMDHILVFGCAALDVTSSTTVPAAGATSEGVVCFTLGGVARNIAEAAHYATAPSKYSVKLVAPLLDDAAGLLISRGTDERGMDTSGLFCSSASSVQSTSSPVASLLLDAKTNDLLSGVTAMNLVEERLSGERIIAAADTHRAAAIAFDANLTPSAMQALLTWKQRHNEQAPILLFEPTTISKCDRVIQALGALGGDTNSTSEPLVDVTTPNIIELKVMRKAALDLNLALGRDLLEPIPDSDAQIREAIELAAPLLAHFGLILVTLGSRGVLCLFRDEAGRPIAHHEKPTEVLGPDEVKSTTGAGDCFAGAVLAALAETRSSSPRGISYRRIDEVRRLAQIGSAASRKSLRSHEAVPRGSIERTNTARHTLQ